jgi:hypothetical protein
VSGSLAARADELAGSGRDVEVALCGTPQITEFDRMRTLTKFKNFSRLGEDGVGFDANKNSLLTYGDFAIALKSAIWKRSDVWKPNDQGPWKLLVGFFDADGETRKEILNEARKWIGPNGADLEFVETSDVKSAHIRILLNSVHNTSSVGRQALKKSKDTYTMRLGYLSKDNTQRHVRKSVIQHEFGHAIGLRHEHQHPNSGLTWKIDALVEKNLGVDWGNCNVPNVSTAKLRRLCTKTVKQFYEAHSVSFHKLSEFDPTSVMLYAFSAETNEEGISVNKMNLISSKDKAFAKMLYPS